MKIEEKTIIVLSVPNDYKIAPVESIPPRIDKKHKDTVVLSKEAKELYRLSINN